MKSWIYTIILSLAFALQAFTAVVSNRAADRLMPMKVQNITKTANGYNVAIELEEPEWKAAGINDEDLTIASLGDYAGQLEVEGYPAVPVTSRMIRIPPRSGVVVEVLSAEYETFTDVEYGAFFGSEIPEGMQRISKGEDSWYPGVLAEATSPAIMHDFRTSNIVTYPVQVNTARREVRVYSEIEIDIRFEGVDDRSALDAWPSAISETFLPWYRQFLDWNENELDEYSLYRGDVVLVMPEDDVLRNALAPWLEWKRQKGWEFDELTDDDVNSWTALNIRAELRDRYEEEKFDYVVIIGDVDGAFGTPSGINITNTNYGIFGDYYYQMMDDDDIYQDIIVGRISVRNTNELNAYVRKVLLYEKTPYMEDTSWYLRGAGLSVADYAGISTTSTVNYAATEAFRLGYTDFDTRVGITGPEPARSQLIQYLNAGVSFYAFRGGIADGYTVNQIHNLNNVRKLFVACELTCGTGKWSAEVESISEAWMRGNNGINSPKAAIAGFGLATHSTHCGLNNGLAVGVSYSALTMLNPEIGQMLWGGQAFIYNSFHPDYATGTYTFRNFAEQCNLMGDPLCWLWTGIPQEIVADVDETIQLGQNSYSVTIADTAGNPLEDAWVTLYKVDDNEDVIARGKSNSEGSVTLNAPYRYEGEALLTITKRNFIPNQTEITVSQPNARIGWVDITFQDDGNNGTDGNENGIPEAGETVGLVIDAKNFGNSNQTNISITGESDDNWIENVSGEITIDGLAGGEESTGDGLILIEIDPEAQQEWLLHIGLEFDTDQSTFVDEFPITVSAPNFIFVEVEDNEDIEPGEDGSVTITIVNIGGSDASASEGRLVMLHPFANASEEAGEFDAMEIGEEASADFTIEAHPESFNGFSAPAQLIVTSEDGQVDTAWFSIPLGTRSSTDPSGPDKYGYYAFDMTDEDFDLHPEFDWVEINPDVNDYDYEGEDTGIDDNNNNQDECLVFELPFEVQYYGETFDSITISSNGWAALGSWPAFYGALRNAPIPGPYGPPYMLAALWDERAQGSIWHYYDEDNHRYIIEWHDSKGRTGTGSYGFPCTYQIIIFGQFEEHITWTGDNEILFQYEEVNQHLGYGRTNPWWTTGITDGTYTDGLQYIYWRDPSPGAVSQNDFDDGLAILWTTNVALIIGTLEGTVTDAATGDPMAGVHVQAFNPMYEAETDENGHFIFEEMVTGEHGVNFTFDCFTDTFVTQITIAEDETTTVNMGMIHPEFALDQDSIFQELQPDEVIHHPLTLTNLGNGPLTYSGRIYIADPREDEEVAANGDRELDNLINLWDLAYSFDLDSAESRNRGIVFVDKYFFVSGSDNFDPVGPNKFYKYSRFEGELLGTYDQPVAPEYRTSQGIYGMAYDGDYVYGVDGNRMFKMVFDLGTGTEEDSIYTVDSWEIEVEDSRYLAYDPDNDVFWMGDLTSPIYTVDRSGQILEEIEQEFAPRGAAWNPNDDSDYNLYFFARPTAETLTQIIRMNQISGETEVMFEFDTPEGGYMVSCADLSGFWHPLIWTFAAVLDNGAQDGVKAWIAGENMSFFEITHPSGRLEGGEELDLDLVFRGSNLPIGDYPFYVGFDNNSCYVENDFLEMTISIPDTIEENSNPEVQPLEWAFKGAYPNPFNPTVTVSFSLKEAVSVNARVYNMLGQQVAVLADYKMAAGHQALTFDGANLSSGMYFLRFEAGPMMEIKKLILMK
ncbi:MAG: C25 family cysteine peptidase [Candidatus Electryonea clarkiae]|nr:C25 family cysteine peptidase [Candidatus Electryonea clarkiae]MDP8288481.1 C25 family cysteine peptidase [Candidatus Electryonea clarkiae]